MLHESAASHWDSGVNSCRIKDIQKKILKFYFLTWLKVQRRGYVKPARVAESRLIQSLLTLQSDRLD
jgi:hypothetical protein